VQRERERPFIEHGKRSNRHAGAMAAFSITGAEFPPPAWRTFHDDVPKVRLVKNPRESLDDDRVFRLLHIVIGACQRGGGP